jgi:protein-S-isoprenylcysteine O-methyltransferase Ste14
LADGESEEGSRSRATEATVNFVPAFAGIAARLLDEEKHLTRDLPGSDEYRRKVRYRLLPGLW